MSWKKNWALLGALGLAVVCFGPARAASAQKLVECPRVYYDSEKTCNCSSLRVELELCHEELVNVSVSVGGGIAAPVGGGSAGGSFSIGTSTGKSSETCASAEVPPGTCIWWRYGFECCPETGLFLTHWACRPLAASIHSGPATPEDCGP